MAMKHRVRSSGRADRADRSDRSDRADRSTRSTSSTASTKSTRSAATNPNHRAYGKDFAAVYEQEWGFWGIRMWPFLREQVERHAPAAATWIDLCCGAGSLLKLVCRAGYEATGVDRSRHQLAHARRNVPAARFVRQDIRALELPERFDIATCLFDSLNYIVHDADLLRAFRGARRHLKSEGLFVFDVNTYEGLEDHWTRTTRMELRGKTLILESTFDPDEAIGRLSITGFVKEGRLYRKFEEEHFERGYRAAEIESMLDRAGFSFRKCDGLTLGRPRKRSPRLVYVCRPS